MGGCVTRRDEWTPGPLSAGIAARYRLECALADGHAGSHVFAPVDENATDELRWRGPGTTPTLYQRGSLRH